MCNIGGMTERLKVAVLKTAVPERVPGVRIPLPPPYSLSSREGVPPCGGNPRNFPANSAILASKPDRREWPTELVTLPFSLLFSAGQIGSPVLKIRLGECNANYQLSPRNHRTEIVAP